MKKSIVIIALALFLPLLASAQHRSVVQFYDKYKNLENVSDVKLQGWLLKLASSFADDETGERILNKITQLRVLVMENQNMVSPQEYDQLVRSVKKNAFEDLIQFKDGDKRVQIMIREEKESITDVLVLVDGDHNFVLLSLEGKLQFKDLNDLQIEVDGAEHFKKLPDNKKEVPRA